MICSGESLGEGGLGGGGEPGITIDMSRGGGGEGGLGGGGEPGVTNDMFRGGGGEGGLGGADDEDEEALPEEEENRPILPYSSFFILSSTNP